MKEFSKSDKMTFQDISNEVYRKYTYPDGATVTITNPARINMKSSGHRIQTLDDTAHYVPSGWIDIEFQTKDDYIWDF